MQSSQRLPHTGSASRPRPPKRRPLRSSAKCGPPSRARRQRPANRPPSSCSRDTRAQRAGPGVREPAPSGEPSPGCSRKAAVFHPLRISPTLTKPPGSWSTSGPTGARRTPPPPSITPSCARSYDTASGSDCLPPARPRT